MTSAFLGICSICVGSRHTYFAGVTAMAGQHRVIHFDPQEAFDAIVYVREVTPARGSLEQKKERG